MTAYSALAEFYDTLMSDVDYDAWAARYGTLLRQNGVARGAQIADIACGTGQITIRLAKAGYRLTGIDLSPPMLGQAQQNAQRNALQIPFVCQDMRRLQLPRPAAALVCACDGINYIPPRELPALFQTFAKALKPGGILLFDVSTEHKLRDVLGNTLMGDDLQSLAYLWQNRYCPEEKKLSMELVFFRQKENGLFARYDETQTQWAHPAETLLTALAAAGFSAVAFSGLSDSAPRETDQRQLFLAIKKEASL